MFVLFVQSQDKKNEHAITGSLLQALDKHHNAEHGEVSTHTDDSGKTGFKVNSFVRA